MFSLDAKQAAQINEDSNSSINREMTNMLQINILKMVTEQPVMIESRNVTKSSWLYNYCLEAEPVNHL